MPRRRAKGMQKIKRRIRCEAVGCQWSQKGYCQREWISLDVDRICKVYASLQRLMEQRPKWRD